MVVNPEKSQAIILDKQKHDYANEIIKFNNKKLILSLLSKIVQIFDKTDSFLKNVSNVLDNKKGRLHL